MSDVMLHGVLRMPIELWTDSDIAKAQLASACEAASDKLYALEEENKNLKAAIDKVCDCGIYPQSIVGKDGYEKRTEYMEGWNAAKKDTLVVLCKSLDTLENEEKDG